VNQTPAITMRGKWRQVRAFVKVSEIVLRQILRCVPAARSWVRARATMPVSLMWTVSETLTQTR
jgi:hypothetical protein